MIINIILLILCICIGFFVGYNIRNKKIEIPESVKHSHQYIKKKIQNKKKERVIREEIEYLNDVLYNIENYDGTGVGQKTVKRGVYSWEK